MSTTQLNPPIELITPLGPAVAYFIWTDGLEKQTFGVFQKKTGESWWWENHLVRLDTSITGGRFNTTPIKMSPEEEVAIAPHRKRHQ